MLLSCGIRLTGAHNPPRSKITSWNKHHHRGKVLRYIRTGKVQQCHNGVAATHGNPQSSRNGSFDGEFTTFSSRLMMGAMAICYARNAEPSCSETRSSPTKKNLKAHRRMRLMVVPSRKLFLKGKTRGSLDPQLVSFSFFSDASYAAVRLLRLEGTLCKTTSQFAIAFFLSPTAV